MNPKNWINPTDFIMSWSLTNLIEYRDVMELKLKDLKCFQSFPTSYQNALNLNLEIKRIENLIYIVNLQIKKTNV